MNNLQLETLVATAITAKEHSYSPYSKFRVGCSLLTEDDVIYTGCNVENASYGLTICAERTALCKAVSEGHRKFKAIAVSTDLTTIVAPCGACRQFIAEFGLDWTVVMIKSKEEQHICTVKEILPFAFDSTSLALNELNNNIDTKNNNI